MSVKLKVIVGRELSLLLASSHTLITLTLISSYLLLTVTVYVVLVLLINPSTVLVLLFTSIVSSVDVVALPYTDS